MTDDAAAERAGSSWREMAVSRSLDPARERAEKRVQRFLDAALELLVSSDGKEFTVQEVVEKSGQSLRSFYQYFAGKYELLLALFEDSIRGNAVHLEAHIADEDDPLERFRLFVFEHYRVCLPTTKSRSNAKKGLAPAMAEFAQQLLTEHPKEASHAFVPIVELLVGILDDAVAAGAIRPGLDHRRVAGTILQTVMFNAFSSTISGTPVRPGDDAAEELWGVIRRGLAPDRT